jgi:hypothetical protein
VAAGRKILAVAGGPVIDLVFVLATVAFFASSVLYAQACDRL